MTIEKAREILGDYGKSKTDDEIQAIITSFCAIIEVGFRQFERQYQIPVDNIKDTRYNLVQ